MTVLRGLLAVLYPFLVFGGLRIAGARWTALVLGALFGLRAVTRWRRPSPAELRRLLGPVAAVGSVLALTLLTDDARLLLAVPVLVNVALFAAFGRTLLSGPTMVETFARLRVPDLPEDEVRYCRGVTQIWCVFFAVNAGISLWLVLAGDVWLWTLYTGFVAYVLVGLLFSVEFLIRARRFGRYEGTLLEPLFRRVFPQRPTP